MNEQIFKIVFYGFLVWLVPFIVSFFIYPLKTAGNPLFESIMPLVITLMVVTLSYQYLKTLKTDLIREGIIIGIVWFVINIAIDMVLFLPASPHAYESDELHGGYWSHIHYDTYDNHWNGIYGS